MSVRRTTAVRAPARWLAAPVLALACLGTVGVLSSCATDPDAGRSAATQPERPTPAQGSAASSTSTARKSVTHDFVIPEGTGAIVDRGEDPGVIPKRLDVHVGDRIRVRNDDTEMARLGIFDVGPGETMTMTFNEVNVLSGILFAKGAEGCGSPPPKNKKFIINVRP